MSSDDAMSTLSSSEMEMIRSVLRSAGYSPDVLVDGKQKLNTATLLLVQLVLSGEASPHELAEQLKRSFGPSTKPSVFFAPLLPRYAIQGLPLVRRTAFRPLGIHFRSDETDLQEWENEGGATRPRTLA
ncbi:MULTISPECIES: hypothetical protein [unclassified Rhizobium]|uniref:hypothetical protein n=1 Tax=unclassified Rhizobium TaxID=2613769 RepID=UPI0007023B13|nr:MULTISPECIES: hypothetical protein [unclassified Rhizobium]KQV38045.1 hypothetical protein ASC86_07315 [Rhizobium sp. Root1212]KRD30702.1 hypothetical protein ASE37_07310 [Rhizobium sp. Root268]